jgi:hypothetical protein
VTSTLPFLETVVATNHPFLFPVAIVSSFLSFRSLPLSQC